MITIRAFAEKDWQAIWPFLEIVFRKGETYAYSPDISETEAFQIWIDQPAATYVAVDEESGQVLGTYYIKPNQPALGAHVCNCGYVTSTSGRGKGIATMMCVHSQTEALALGFKAMQFNLVVATNEDAIHLWLKLGFAQVGVLPGAFNHQRLGYVNALVMYKQLA